MEEWAWLQRAGWSPHMGNVRRKIGDGDYTVIIGQQLYISLKLDDGWPESVEEQGLLLLEWRRNFRNDL